MSSRYYAALTTSARDLKYLEAKYDPEWFSPLTAEKYKGVALPLWRFRQVQSFSGKGQVQSFSQKADKTLGQKSELSDVSPSMG